MISKTNWEQQQKVLHRWNKTNAKTVQLKSGEGEKREIEFNAFYLHVLFYLFYEFIHAISAFHLYDYEDRCTSVLGIIIIILPNLQIIGLSRTLFK